jgi:hypothetical protein
MSERASESLSQRLRAELNSSGLTERSERVRRRRPRAARLHLAAALDSGPPAREHWEAFPRSVRRSILEWIVQARRPETRTRRVAETADMASRNERANQWRRP